jgi:uncharacterized membrane protein
MATFSYDADGRAAGINAASSFKTSRVCRITLEVGVIMAPLIVMLVIWLATRVMGLTGWWAQANSSRWALRIALAGMFLFTAVSHFHPRTRPDLVQMVPPGLPEPALLVTATGVLELGGAAGLLVPPVARAAAFGLIGLLAAMFPANLYAAQQGLIVAGRPASPLVWRLPLQLFWMWALWWTTRDPRATPRPAGRLCRSDESRESHAASRQQRTDTNPVHE